MTKIDMDPAFIVGSQLINKQAHKSLLQLQSAYKGKDHGDEI